MLEQRKEMAAQEKTVVSTGYIIYRLWVGRRKMEVLLTKMNSTVAIAKH